jgi:hypothetical protein
MRSSKSFALAASVLVTPFILIATKPAAALTVSASSNPVNILGTDYNVFFNKETQSSTSFNNVFGTGSPTLTFTTKADATAAVNAILASVPAAKYDPFGLPSSGFAGFFVPFIYSGNSFNRVGANYLVPSGPAFFLDAPNNNDTYGRNQAFNFSFVTFEKATAIPTPALLPGLLGMGLAVVRRQKQRNSSAV